MSPDYNSYGGSADMMAMMGPYFAVIALVGIAIAAFSIFCWWKIFSKAGYNGALALVFLAGIIPIIGPIICLVLFVWFAFSDWPATRARTASPV